VAPSKLFILPLALARPLLGFLALLVGFFVADIKPASYGKMILDIRAMTPGCFK
jgi:hypothetical protein